MAEGNYKERNIYSFKGELLDEQAKEAAYNMSQETIQALKADDDVILNIELFMQRNQTYINNNLNLNKPYNDWTRNEAIRKIKAAKREASLGGIGFFESEDRVRNFKNRIALTNLMSEEMRKYNEARTDAKVDACIAYAASNGKALQLNKGIVGNIAANWLPLLNILKNENSPIYQENFEGIEPAMVFANLHDKNLDPSFIYANFLQIIEDTDMEQFAYNDNASFSADFAKKYAMLKAFADGAAMIEHIKKMNNSKFQSKRALLDHNEDSNKIIEAKCKMAGELLRDYENRMRLYTSPYYSLLSGRDFLKLTDDKIRKLKRPGHDALNSYLEDVILYRSGRNSTYRGVNITEKLNTYITGVQPAPAPIYRNESDKTRETMVYLMQTMYADSKRASSYVKVREAIRKFLQAETAEIKEVRFGEAIYAASAYLKERSKSSYLYRKERCEELVSLYNKYNSELNQERQAIINAQEEQQHEQQIREARENELKNLADKMHEANVQKVNAEKERERREEELKSMADNARNKASAKVKKLDEDLANQNENTIKQIYELERIYRERQELIATATQLFNKYDELGTIGKSYKDSEELRKNTLNFLDKYVFKDDKKLDDNHSRADMDTIPTAMLISAIKANFHNITSPDYIKLVKNDISAGIWDNAKSHDEIRKPITDRLNMDPEKVTELDRLIVYEYSVHALEHIRGEKGLKYDSLSEMDLKKLGTIAAYSISLFGNHHDFNKKETFDELSEAKREIYIKEAAAILSLLSGVDSELYMFLPIEELGRYAYGAVNNLQNADMQKTLLEECQKKATEIKTNRDTLFNAIESVDKTTLISAIATVTGEAQSDLQDIPTVDLVVLAEHMFTNVRHYDEMKNT